jgi:hypothetical protein
VRTLGGIPYDQLKGTLTALPNVQRVERYDANHATSQWGTLQVLGVDWDTLLLSDDLAARSGLHREATGRYLWVGWGRRHERRCPA